MNHCIIMTAYKDVNAINNLIKATPLKWGIYIHVDKKNRAIIPLISKRATIISKFTVYWGAWEHFKAIINLLEIASKDKYDYYHIISGQDYFGMSPERIDGILSSYNGCNCINYFPVPFEKWTVWGGGLDIFRLYTISSFWDVRYGIGNILNGWIIKFQKCFPVLMRKLPEMNLYGSSVYCSLHSSFVHWMLSDPISIGFINSLRFSTCCEEVIIATLLKNSPYSEKCINSYRYINWNRPGLVLNDEDFDAIVNQDYFFCRKVDSIQSVSLFNKLRLSIIRDQESYRAI